MCWLTFTVARTKRTVLSRYRTRTAVDAGGVSIECVVVIVPYGKTPPPTTLTRRKLRNGLWTISKQRARRGDLHRTHVQRCARRDVRPPPGGKIGSRGRHVIRSNSVKNNVFRHIGSGRRRREVGPLRFRALPAASLLHAPPFVFKLLRVTENTPPTRRGVEVIRLRVYRCGARGAHPRGRVRPITVNSCARGNISRGVEITEQSVCVL